MQYKTQLKHFFISFIIVFGVARTDANRLLLICVQLPGQSVHLMLLLDVLMEFTHRQLEAPASVQEKVAKSHCQQPNSKASLFSRIHVRELERCNSASYFFA
jgi:hypothetical protein